MLKRINRLSTKKDIALVYAKGSVVHGRLFVLKSRSNDLPNSRFGFIVSTKISKKAVVRNQVKRRMREAVRLIFDKIQPGNDVVLIAKNPVKDADFKMIASDINQVLTKRRLLN
jgi:ribonuclease P protein component